ncbi:MAG: hypothetical protein IKF39_01835 [Oscillospiraceae bacterium]|nr:hypothetical protein [Oscillospiraceae bacterium]
MNQNIGRKGRKYKPRNPCMRGGKLCILMKEGCDRSCYFWREYLRKMKVYYKDQEKLKQERIERNERLKASKRWEGHLLRNTVKEAKPNEDSPQK